MNYTTDHWFKTRSWAVPHLVSTNLLKTTTWSVIPYYNKILLCNKLLYIYKWITLGYNSAKFTDVQTSIWSGLTSLKICVLNKNYQEMRLHWHKSRSGPKHFSYLVILIGFDTREATLFPGQEWMRGIEGIEGNAACNKQKMLSCCLISTLIKCHINRGIMMDIRTS